MFQNSFVGKLNFAKTPLVGTLTNMVPIYQRKDINFSSATSTKWSNALKQFVGCCRRMTIMFDHFLGLALKGSKHVL